METQKGDHAHPRGWSLAPLPRTNGKIGQSLFHLKTGVSWLIQLVPGEGEGAPRCGAFRAFFHNAPEGWASDHVRAEKSSVSALKI